MATAKLQYFAIVNGKQVSKTVEIGVEAYKKAAKHGRTLREQMRYEAPDFDRSMGDVIDQMMNNAALRDGARRIGPAITMGEMAHMTAADGFRRPDGSDNSLGARLLYPQLILETIQANALDDDGSDILAIWERMIAVQRNVNGTKVEQPIIDTSGPEESRSGRIAQLAEPETMISITTGQKSYKIPTNSVGLIISDEAMDATTIDLVTTVMSAQARGDKIRRVNEQVRAMVLGDPDVGIAALPVTKIGIYDPAITTNNTITKRAYIKWLHSIRKKVNISMVLTDIDSAITIDENLAPTHTGVDNSKIVTPWGGVNLGLTQPEIVPFDVEVFGAGILVGLDPRYAVQRFTNVGANYDAIEEYVMRKATAFRVDYGEMATRLNDEAWSVVSLQKA